MDLGSLFDLLDAVKTIPEIILGEIIYQILSGLQYLHKEMKIIHRDIKPGNLICHLLTNSRFFRLFQIIIPQKSKLYFIIIFIENKIIHLHH